MTSIDKSKLLFQIDELRDIAKDYPGKTIENIIMQMIARLREPGDGESVLDILEELESEDEADL